MNLGLRIMRRISPPPDLEAALDRLGQLHEIADTAGKVHKYVSDDDRRDVTLNLEITGGWDAAGRVTHIGCTDLFALMDDDNNIHYIAKDAAKAEKALAGARVTVTPIVEVDVEEVEESDEGLPDLPPPVKGAKLAAASA